MRPKPLPSRGDDLFRPRLDAIIDARHPLVQLAGLIDWARFDAAFGSLYAEIGDPNTQLDMLREVSPLFHADKIERPLLVLQGENDPRVLKQESDSIVEAVKKNGVPVEYLVFENEGHGFRRKDSQKRAYEATLTFLDKYLKAPSQ